MSWAFRRPFRLLERIYTPSGLDDQAYPTRVSEIVQPIWDSAKARTGDVIFDCFNLSTTITANPFTLNTATSRVPSGRVRIVLHGALFNGEGAARSTVFSMIDNGVAEDPWGSWLSLAPGAARVFAGTVSAAATAWTSVPTVPWWFPDMDVQAVMSGVAALGEPAILQMYFVELPTELLSVEHR